MGRPIAKKYFGNTNPPDNNFAVGGPTGTGGEGVASVALGTAGSGYSKGLTTSVTAPEVAGGTTALVSVTTDAAGVITGYTVTNAGGGYLAAPTVSLVLPATVTPTGTGVDTELTIVVSSVTGLYAGMAASGTNVGVGATVVSFVKSTKVVTLSVANAGAVSGVITFADAGAAGVPGAATLTAGVTARPDAIVMTAWTTLAGAARTNCDVKKQLGSRRYKITSSDGVGNCKLVARVPAAVGEASLVATDSSGKTYYVTKLTSHKALLTQFGAGVHEFASGTEVRWTLDSAVLNTMVSVANV